ncbi:formate dehydrogenase accessory protein FdhE domain-containing protein [Bartonella raoultii]|uniref:Formate dehydrogenase accessory protein FdhE n=1 Tax=Bartonella raoultii TaxID=1457020 RepID=A0ABS7I3L6_9HYPH|nr:formate dehydrogenase accessory protein FdhE [Bartonella raoultii]MBX4335266.1 formate dehydrogenase accessory protein FdhE [Bartonella raoultii]
MHSSPFVILPDPKTLFAKRYARFTDLAKAFPHKEPLLFFAHFCHAQQQSLKRFQDFSVALCRFSTSTSPPFNRSKLLILGFYESVVADFLKRLSHAPLLGPALLPKREESLRNTQQEKDQWRAWGRNLLEQQVPHQQGAEHIVILGALQIIYSLTASQLDTQTLTMEKNNLCPACSGTPSASLIMDWQKNENLRFYSCLYCNTLWYSQNNQCSFCKSPKKQKALPPIRENTEDILLEICEKCEKYSPQFNHHKNPLLDVFADAINIASSDFLQQISSSLKPENFNPFLATNR